MAAAGFQVKQVLGIEGPGWLIWRERWVDPWQRAQVLDTARAVETESAVLGASAHIVVIAHSPVA